VLVVSTETETAARRAAAVNQIAEDLPDKNGKIPCAIPGCHRRTDETGVCWEHDRS
jgi:hypothetical protein